MKFNFSNSQWSIIFLGIIFFVGSCVTVDQIVHKPPTISGSDFVGSESCATCHEEQAKTFKFATHARLQAKGQNAENIGCESCHGPGSLHMESGGKKGTIINPRRAPDTCFQCHLDKQAEFSLPHHHPVIEEKITCADCHDPHKGDAVKGHSTAPNSPNETCFQCHTAQKGPFVFEHEALREGCTVCHSPHGSINERMLKERNQNLCLKCHFQQQTTAGQILIGGSNHAGRLGQGTCWSAGCHEAVHGSNYGTSQRF